MNINFSTATRGKLHAPHIVPRWELIHYLWLKRCASFSHAPQEEFSLSSRDVRGTLCFLSQVEWTREALTQKKAQFPCSGLNSGSPFMSQDEGMTESPVDPLEKVIGFCLIWTGGLTSLLLREGSSGGACLKLAYLFNRILGISLLLETIRVE